MDEGFRLHMWAGTNEDPPCITIFSAPNYCFNENPGSILVTAGETTKAKVLTFMESHYNYYIPSSMPNEEGEFEMIEYPDEPLDILTESVECINNAVFNVL